jgi:hypothetical protein
VRDWVAKAVFDDFEEKMTKKRYKP